MVVRGAQNLGHALHPQQTEVDKRAPGDAAVALIATMQTQAIFDEDGAILAFLRGGTRALEAAIEVLMERKDAPPPADQVADNG